MNILMGLIGLRVIRVPPSHPMLALLYSVIAPFVVLFLIVVVLGSSIVLPASARVLTILGAVLLGLSPYLSYYNIVVKEEVVVEEERITFEYVVFMGIPLPVPVLAPVVRRKYLAVNIGGALIPVIVSILFLYSSSFVLDHSTKIFAAAYLVTTAVTAATARSIPGLGIAVPSLVPPLTSSIVVVMLAGSGPPQALVAYAAGSLGSLTGADIIRLALDWEKLKAPLLSIGGVGVFDGVFLSGAISLILTL